MTGAAPRDELRQALAAHPELPASDAMRQFWQAGQEWARQEHQRGAGGLDTARALAALTDAVVLETYDRARPLAGGRPHALAALGGYGRQEMAPFSDIDLLFLFPRGSDEKPEFLAGVLHPLWDLGFAVGHSSRTLAAAVAIGRSDLESCTAMLDARLLAGDAAVFAAFQERFYGRLPKALVAKLQKGRRAQAGTGASVQLLEPNVKESPGGLREIQILEWALKAHTGRPELEGAWDPYLGPEDLEALRRGRAFLWRVRHQLHFDVGRRHDVLEHELKPGTAHHLGYRDEGPELAAERFMRDYYLHARAVHHLAEQAFAQLLRRPGAAGRPLLLEEGVAVTHDEIFLPDGPDYFAADPLRLLRVFVLAQARRLRLSEQVQRAARAALPLMTDAVRRSPAARDLFLQVLRRKHGVAQTLRAMHEVGVLGAYLPEFGAATGLVQYDIYHLYTVDEHTLVALENLEALGRGEGQDPLRQAYAELARRDLVYLAVLLHDIGKSKRQEHISCGVTMSRELLARLDLPEEDRPFVLFLVEHHQDMVTITRRRDLDDYRMIAEFAGLFANLDWLRALYLVSYADLSAVARDAWTDWQGALLVELYHKTGEQLQSGLKTLEEKHWARQRLDEHLQHITGAWPTLRVRAFQEHVEQLSARYLVAYDREQIVRHLELVGQLGDGVVAVGFAPQGDHTEVAICARDQHLLLAKICGVLAVNDINILQADVNTRDDELVLDIFQVTDVDGTPELPDWKQTRVRERLEAVIAGRTAVEQLFEKHSQPWSRRRKEGATRPAKVEFENQVSDRYTVIDVEAQDRVGLLYRITHFLGEQELDIHMAIIHTVADRAIDAFYVVDRQGEKILNYDALRGIRQGLIDRLSS